LKPGEAITKITPLLRKNKESESYQAKLHQSIVVFMKDKEAADHGFYINCSH
jgi:hypothetical protein